MTKLQNPATAAALVTHVTGRTSGFAAAVLALALAVGALAPQAQAQDAATATSAVMAGMACTATAKAARTACQNEAKSDYWIAIGDCANLSDPAAQSDCLDTAAADRSEQRTLCGEQYDARLNLCAAVGEAPYDPMLDPADFLTEAELLAAATPNTYFPLVPGTTYQYVGGGETDEVTVTDQVVTINGIPALAVRDVVSEAGEVVEDTVDWYGQDVLGNVWYMGEISKELEDGQLVGLEGSWKAGRDYAKPGIIMPAMPAVGDVYRQEFALGAAEDAGEVLSITGTATTPAASCAGDCVVTADFSPLEPDVLEHKYYVPGLGLILEVDTETGERVELVGVTP